MKVAVICEAGSQNGIAACEAFRSAGHEAECVIADQGIPASLQALRPDVAFNAMCEGAGLAGAVQDALSFLEIPCIGASAQACKRAFDKSLLPGVMESYWAVAGADLTASWPLGVCISRQSWEEWGMSDALELLQDRIPGGFPLCVKPARCEGAVRVDSMSQLRDAIETALKACDDMLVQQWIEGVRIEACIIGSGWDAFVLPPVEKLAEGQLVAPVRLASLSHSEEDAQAIRSEIERAALEAYWAFNMQDCASIDMIWDGGQPRVIRVRPAVSVEEGSAFRMACSAAGLSVPAVMNELAEARC